MPTYEDDASAAIKAMETRLREIERERSDSVEAIRKAEADLAHMSHFLTTLDQSRITIMAHLMALQQEHPNIAGAI